MWNILRRPPKDCSCVLRVTRFGCKARGEASSGHPPAALTHNGGKHIVLGADSEIHDCHFARGDPMAAIREVTLAFSSDSLITKKETVRMEGTLLSNSGKIGRDELALVPAPPGTATHKVIPHHEVINALVDTLSLRHIAPVREEYAVSKDGMKMFGIMEIEPTFQGCRFALGIRNAHDKSMRLAMTVGYSRTRLRQHGVLRGLHARARQTLQKL